MNEQTQESQQVPLIELLRNVPKNSRLIVDSADGMGSTFHPVGRLCHEAAEALAQPATEPLTDHAIDAIAHLNFTWEFSSDELKQFARAIEKAHGIGEGV